MGMEGKLRQVSEFELATFRKNPEKFYAQLMSKYTSGGIATFTSAMTELHQSSLAQQIEERADSGLPPLQADLDALRERQEAIIRENQDAFAELQADTMGLSKDGLQLSLYKDWHVLHYLLTGKSWERSDSPLARAIMGGAELPDPQNVMGYGPARFLTPTQVHEVAKALEDISIEERIASFDPQAAKAARVYPVFDENAAPDEADKQELVEYFRLLKEFYRDAAERRNGVIIWVQ